MPSDSRSDLTPREVALLAEVPKRAVEKAIEERVLRIRRSRGVLPKHKGGFAFGRERRHLGAESVVYVAMVKNLNVTLSTAGKRALATHLRNHPLNRLLKAKVPLAPAVEADVGALAGRAVERARWYLRARGRHIVMDPAIKGGVPVIKGTRLSVYAVAGRIDHGDSIEEIAKENPDIPREALEAAVIYAKAHPPVGRPGGKHAD